MDEDMKADDQRFIHRSAISGLIVSEEYARLYPETTVTEAVNDYSAWLKNWIQHGIDMENGGDLDGLAVSAVIHAQVLKRVD